MGCVRCGAPSDDDWRAAARLGSPARGPEELATEAVIAAARNVAGQGMCGHSRCHCMRDALRRMYDALDRLDAVRKGAP